MEIRILCKRFLVFFSNIWNTGAIYKIERMGERSKSYSTPTSVLNEGETKLFQMYWVFLSIK